MTDDNKAGGFAQGFLGVLPKPIQPFVKGAWDAREVYRVYWREVLCLLVVGLAIEAAVFYYCVLPRYENDLAAALAGNVSLNRKLRDANEASATARAATSWKKPGETREMTRVGRDRISDLLLETEPFRIGFLAAANDFNSTEIMGDLSLAFRNGKKNVTYQGNELLGGAIQASGTWAPESRLLPSPSDKSKDLWRGVTIWVSRTPSVRLNAAFEEIFRQLEQKVQVTVHPGLPNDVQVFIWPP